MEAVSILALTQIPQFSVAAGMDTYWIVMAGVVMVSVYGCPDADHNYYSIYKYVGNSSIAVSLS